MSSITMLETDNFNEKVKDSRAKVAVLFTAEWCETCRDAIEEFRQASNAFKAIQFYSVDIDASEPLASQNEIPGIPAVIVFENGEETAKLVGVKAMEHLQKALSDIAGTQNDTKE
ncbi:thioredoxin family protein [Planctomycetota bacterium]